MSTIRKTYMLRWKDRMQTKVMVDGRPVLVEFKNASRSNKNVKGIFSTNNPALIEALEKCGEFNKSFRLHRTDTDFNGPTDALHYRGTEINPDEKDQSAPLAKEVKAETEKPKPEQPKVEEKTDQPVKEEQAKPEGLFVKNDEVANIQEAKEYLKQKFPELTARQLGNKKLVLDMAKEKGVIFEALNN